MIICICPGGYITCENLHIVLISTLDVKKNVIFMPYINKFTIAGLQEDHPLLT